MNYTQYLCDQLDDLDPTDRIAKVRCKNILNQISRDITVTPKGAVQPIPAIVDADVTVLRHFIKKANHEIERPGIRNVSPFRDKKEFQHDAALLVTAFDQILDTLLWYAKEKNIKLQD